MKRAIFTFVLCAILAAVVDAEVKIADCARENVTDVGLLDGKTPVVCYYTEEEGLISIVRKYYVDIGGKTEGPYEHEQHYKDIEKRFTPNKKPPYITFDGGWYIITAKQKYGPYDEVSDIILAPDGKTYAYMALKKSNSYGSDLYVITGEGKEGPYSQYFGLDYAANKLHIRFSPDSKTLAYVVEYDNESYVVVNGEKSEPYPHSDVNGFVFSPDSKTLAYVVHNDYYEDVVVGKEKIGLLYKEVSDLTFSPDSKLLAYKARIDGGWYVVVDKEKAGPYSEIRNLTFSPDSKRLTYIAKQYDEEHGYYIFSGMEKIGPYWDVTNPVFLPDGKLLAYVAEVEGNSYVQGHCYVIKNGEKIGPYDGIFNLMLSPDGETLVYEVEVLYRGHGGVGYCIVVGENIAGEYKKIFPIMFLNGGKEVAYWAEDDSGSWYLFYGKDKDGPYDSQKSEWNEEKRIYEAKLYETQLSPDGKKLAYTAKKDGKWYLVVGKDKIGPHDGISWPTFSHDGDIFGYSVETKDEPSRKYVLIDGTPYIGSICGGHAVYLKDGAIWTR